MAQYQDVRRLSIELSSAFACSMYSENSRQFKYINDAVTEVLENLTHLTTRYHKIVGSHAEGTNFENSDKDYLCFYPKITVGYKPQKDVPFFGKTYLCLTRDKLTPAGYTKLQIVLNGEKSGKQIGDNLMKLLEFLFRHKIHRHARHSIFLTNRVIFKHPLLEYEKHGPAQTILVNDSSTLDTVVAFESKVIPVDMKCWFERTRLKNWPSKTTCELFNSMGCCYVGVGHANSPDQDLEWRISPTRQELYLMMNISPTQFRCYVTLKLIKTYLIQPYCGDVISSYHCKTALFWTIENNDSDIWQPDYLIYCIMKCLGLLHVWVSKQNCPNYFISEENMFETKLITEHQSKMLQERLGTVISFCFVSHSDIYLYSLFPPVQRFKIYTIKKYEEITGFCVTASALKRAILSEQVTSIPVETLMIQENIRLIKTKPRDICLQKYRDMVSPHKIDIAILLEMLEEKLKCLKRIANIKFCCWDKTFSENDISANLNDMSNESQLDDQFCLKIASLAASRGEYSMCNILLQNVYGLGRIDIICMCSVSLRIGELELKLKDNLLDSSFRNIANNIELTGICFNQLPIKYILQQFTLYLQFDDSEYQYESGLAIPPLHFDAHKTIGIPPELMFYLSKRHKLQDLISIHPMAYLYFLQYKNSEKIDKKCDMCVALEKLEHMNLISLQKHIYCHPDTTLNLLGHIYTTIGWYTLALQCFRRSWQIQHHYNAVKWHVMFMMFGKPKSENDLI